MSTYNEEENVAGSGLESEYDSVFEDDERASNFLKLTSDAFTRESRKIKLKEIGFSEPIKEGRRDTLSGLTASVCELGVLTPIHVMTVPKEAEDDDYMYVLLDGLRRVYGAMRNGQKEIDAVVWDFEDKDKGTDLGLVVSLTLNRNQQRSWGERWHLLQVLEMQSAITPGTLEYFLQLESGDAMKLKDVMLCDYEEVKMALLNNEKNLDACYKMLTKLRKEEDKLAMEDATGVSDTVEGVGDITSSDSNNETEDGQQLSEQDVLELLEMADSLDDNISEDDFSELNTGAFDDEHQKVGARHPVDPAIRQGTFQRDKFRCRCCGTGGVAFLATLVYHHAIPVSCHGSDSVDNGLTLCDSCHQTLHCAEKAGGKIPMTKEQFEEYDEEEQIRIKKILKYAKVAVEAHKRCGNSREKITEEANRSARHRMPGETLKESQRSFASTLGSNDKGEE